MAFEAYYDINPISTVDQNQWLDKEPLVAEKFRTAPVIYTPLIDWTDRSGKTGALTSQFTELIEGDIDNDEISFTANYIPEPFGVDSRSRRLTVKRYGDKVQYHKSDSYFNQWKLSGGRDWRPILGGLLGTNVVQKFERISRNAFLSSPTSFWTYGGNATNWNTIGADDKFSLEMVNAWNLRLGNLGAPVIPGDAAAAKVVIVPPGAIYDFQQSLASASSNEAALWRDATLYSEKLRYEIGSYKNIRFVEAKNDRYGINPNVLYNCGAVTKQVNVTAVIHRGDGSPDPEAEMVDGVWEVGQKDVQHYIQCSDFADGDFSLNEIVTLHTVKTTAYGVTDGVNPLSGKTINRRIVKIDHTNNRLSFDRPVFYPYETDLGGGVYAYITKGKHIGFSLVMGSRGGIMGNVNKPVEFYNPRPIDDYDSVWRFTWDTNTGWNLWDPSFFECHFTAVSLPKPGGIITP